MGHSLTMHKEVHSDYILQCKNAFSVAKTSYYAKKNICARGGNTRALFSTVYGLLKLITPSIWVSLMNGVRLSYIFSILKLRRSLSKMNHAPLALPPTNAFCEFSLPAWSHILDLHMSAGSCSNKLRHVDPFDNLNSKHFSSHWHSPLFVKNIHCQTNTEKASIGSSWLQ